MARRLADRLGFVFLDTGALYRAVAYLALERGVAPTDADGVEALVAAHAPEVITDVADPLTYRIRIDGKLLGQELFALPVSQAVSPLAKAPDAVEIDTSSMTVDQVVDRIVRQVRMSPAR